MKTILMILIFYSLPFFLPAQKQGQSLIDSLQTALQVENGDTNRVNTLNILSEQIWLKGDYMAGNQRLFIIYRDSLVNQESSEKIARMQMQFEQEKKDALAIAEIKRQTLIRNSTFGGIGIASSCKTF